MKILFASFMLLTLLIQEKCNKGKRVANCYKGRLEIKALCGNYTIALVEGQLDSSKIQASWTDEQTSKIYKNVFALGSPCSFPDSIQAGQEFYFTIEPTIQNCMVCQAYYPKPAKSLSIKVVDKACQ